MGGTLLRLFLQSGLASDPGSQLETQVLQTFFFLALTRMIWTDCFVSSAFCVSVTTCMWVLLSIPIVQIRVQDVPLEEE